jgi:hypothetical protein
MEGKKVAERPKNKATLLDVRPAAEKSFLRNWCGAEEN